MAKTKHAQAKPAQKSSTTAKPVSKTNGQVKKQVTKKRGALLTTLLVVISSAWYPGVGRSLCQFKDGLRRPKNMDFNWAHPGICRRGRRGCRDVVLEKMGYLPLHNCMHRPGRGPFDADRVPVGCLLRSHPRGNPGICD